MIPVLIAAGLAFLVSGCHRAFRREDEPIPSYPLDRAKTGREPESARVRAFEGLTLADFEQSLPRFPERSEVLQKLKYIIAGTDIPDRYGIGDPAKIDPLWETLRAARLFLSDPQERAYPHLWPLRITEEDLNIYQYDAHVRFWEQNRDKVSKEFQLADVDHPFAHLFDELPIPDLPTMRGLPSYDQLAKELMPMLPHLRSFKQLHVLYPGSGFHIAPLITAFRLIDSGVLNKATYTYTEIDPNDFQRLISILRSGLEGVVDGMTIEKKIEFPGEGSEQTVVLEYKGRPIRIVFALNRSGEDYYRKEYLKEADLVVIHDPGNGAFADSFDLLAKILLDKQAIAVEKPQAVIMEGRRKGHPSDQFGFPSDMPQVLLPGSYGHCAGGNSVAEIEFCDFDSARAFPLHDPALLSLAAKHASEDELSRTLYPLGRDELIFMRVE